MAGGKMKAGVFFLLVIFHTGCMVQKEIAVEITFPPKVMLPAEAHHMLLVLSVPERVNTDASFVCVSVHDRLCIQAAGERALIGFSERMFEEGDIEISGILEWVDTLEGQDRRAEPLELETICESPDTVDLVLYLDHLDLEDSLVFSTYKRWPREARNKIWSKTILYRVEPQIMQQAEMKIFSKAWWKIYDCRTKRFIFEGLFRDSVSYKVDGATVDEVKKKLPSLRTASERAGYVLGWNLSALLLPSSTTVLRRFYTSRSRLMREATRMVRFRQWDKAVNAWEKALEQTKGARKARLLYNLALASERHGDYDKALEYLDTAWKLYPSEEIRRYRSLIEREREKRKY